MGRSMMQLFVKGSEEAFALYQKAFNAEVLCQYPHEDGGYMHAELSAYGQVIAVSEITEEVTTGNTMMFCFELGEGSEEKIRTAYEVLKQDAIDCTPLGKCDYSPCQFVVTDKFGVIWCIWE